MTYRQQATVERYEEPAPVATFSVRHRSWGWLAYAAVLAAAAAGFAVEIVIAAQAPLAVAGSMSVIVLAAAACHAACQGSGDVEMTATPRVDDQGLSQGVEVVVRRRWAFFPWAAPLTFTASRCPALVTRWVTGWTSGKYSRSRDYRRASMILDVGGAEILLPIMRGPSRRVGEDLVADIAPAAREAKQRYDQEVAALGHPDMAVTSAPPADQKRFLIGSSEGAASRTAAGAMGAILAVTIALGLAGYYLPVSRLATVCSALVLPLLGGGIAIVSLAVTKGRTLYLRRDHQDHVVAIAVADTFLFGPRGETARVLARDFDFRIEDRRVGEDDDLVHALVETRTGDVLRQDADKGAVRQFGRRLGGRET